MTILNMDGGSDRYRAADGKQPTRRSSRSGASKKSSSRPRASFNPATEPSGGEQALNRERNIGDYSSDSRRSSGGREVRQDNHDALSSSAQSKGYGADHGSRRTGVGGRQDGHGRAPGAKSSRGGRHGAEGVGRHSYRTEERGEIVDRDQGERHMQERSAVFAEGRVAQGVGGDGGVDRAILDKWKTEAVTAAGERLSRGLITSAEPQDTPEEVDEDNAGDGYDDDGFEEYSDDSDQQQALISGGVSVMQTSSIVGRGGAGGSCGGGRPSSSLPSPVLSPAVKKRPVAASIAPDDEVLALRELRHSLREENDMARDRSKNSRSSNSREDSTADSKSSNGGNGRVAKGAKGAKGTRGDGRGERQGEAGVSRGKFSTEASSEAGIKGNTRPRSRSFKMADAKALGRALAKGDPRAERVRSILSTSRLETESVRLFDQAPITPLDLYHRRLRGQSAKIRQTATQTNEDARSVEAQTDEIVKADKEIQFHLGHDDTALENLMRRLRSARRPPQSSPSSADRAGAQEGSSSTHMFASKDSDNENVVKTTFKGIHLPERDDSPPSAPVHGIGENTSVFPPSLRSASSECGAGPLRLGRFLRQACVVMETLCEENLLALFAKSTSRNAFDGDDENAPLDDDQHGRVSLFPRGDRTTAWEELGGKYGRGGVVKSGVPPITSSSFSGDILTNNRDTSHNSAPHRVRSLVEGFDIVGIAFSRAKRSMLVTAHARETPENGSWYAGITQRRERRLLEGCGVVCVWNAEDVTASPVNLLFGEGVFRSLCLPLRQPHIVIAGTAEGFLLLWDLREPSSSSHAAEAKALGLQCGLRSPTYTTAGGGGISDPAFGHASSIVSVVAIPVSGGESSGLGGILSLGESNSCQVASLDDRGTLSIWLVSEISRGDEGGSQTDLGLSPGGRVRLTISKSIPLTTAPHSALRPPGDKVVPSSSMTFAYCAAAHTLAFSASDPNNFFIGESSGRIQHASRLGEVPPPRAYRGPRRESCDAFSRSRLGSSTKRDEGEMIGMTGEGGAGGVRCLSFSPFFQRYFLAGCGDGSVRLYKDDCAVPLTTWEEIFSATNPSDTQDTVAAALTWSPPAIASLAWSEHRPAVFFVLDSAGALCAFDVLANEARPVAFEKSPALPDTAVSNTGDNGRARRGYPDDGKGEDNEQTDPAAPGVSENDIRAGAGRQPPRRCWALPSLALSADTLRTGSRPRVAVAVQGRAFTRKLSARLFRALGGSSIAGAAGGGGGDSAAKNGRGRDGVLEGGGSEKERMEEWLRTIL